MKQSTTTTMMRMMRGIFFLSCCISCPNEKMFALAMFEYKYKLSLFSSSYLRVDKAKIPVKQTKIVGGIPTIKGRYPYQVGLMSVMESTSSTSTNSSTLISSTNSQLIVACGGTLIASEWVLTAAHCHEFGNRVHIGQFNVSEHTLEIPNVDYEEMYVQYSVIHPLYNPITFDYDVMLLKLHTPSNYTPVKLAPTLEDDRDSSEDGLTTALTITNNDIYTILGWGSMWDKGPRSEVLLEAQVDVINFRVCQRRYALYGGITKRMMCASRKGRDSCQGDSGGPLLIQKFENKEMQMQVGIVSWGLNCGSTLFPGVYTRISEVRDFILETVDEFVHDSEDEYEYDSEDNTSEKKHQSDASMNKSDVQVSTPSSIPTRMASNASSLSFPVSLSPSRAPSFSESASRSSTSSAARRGTFYHAFGSFGVIIVVFTVILQ